MCISFEVSAMRIAVKSGGKVKRDAFGAKVYDERIIPKGRPRTARAKGGGKSHTYTPEATVKFEKHIRECFFKEYPPVYGVMAKGVVAGVHRSFIGCQLYSSSEPCDLYRKGKDFDACKTCGSRRKNLGIQVTAMLKDDRHVDGDNIIKTVLDALERVCFYNDTQFNKKNIEIVPYAERERLVVEIRSEKEYFYKGSVIGGYDPKSLSVSDAKNYVWKLFQSIVSEDDRHDFISYLNRRDKRKYLGELNAKINRAV